MSEKKEKNLWKFIKENAVYFLAFLIPVLIMAELYNIRNIYPFGDEMYLRSDMYHQYAPFYRELARKLASGQSLSYSWNIGMGVNFTALAAYYLASPMNIILGAFNSAHIIELMSILIILKMGLSSFTFTYYLSKKFESKNIVIGIFGIFYAMSSYLAAFNWNIMWLDCLVLLPIIILGLEKLVKENKSLMYCIALGVAIFSNYYIGIMLCIFSVLYFIYMMIVTKPDGTPFYFVRKIVRFGLYSALAGGLAACMVIPAAVALMGTASGDFTFDWKLSNYFTMFFMLSRSYMDVPVAVFEAHDPNLYCTVAAFLAVPLFWLNKKISMKERVGKTVLIVIMLLSFSMNIPNYIWHGFHFPNSLPARESFIYIFLILVMAYEGIRGIKEYTNKQILTVYGIVVALSCMIEQMFVNTDKYTFKIIYYSLAFITLYLIAIFAYRALKKNHKIVVYLVYVVCVSEVIINWNTTALSTTNRTAYVKDNAAIENLAKQAEKDSDTKFFRMEKYNRRTKNDATWHGYHGMSIFSSMASKGTSDYYTKLGFEESYNAYSYYGHTPLTESLFSVKYVFSNAMNADSDLTTLVGQQQEDKGSDSTSTVEAPYVYLYKNNYTLPLGFMVDSNISANWEFDGTNPFYVQNSFVKAACGAADVFDQIDGTQDGTSVRATIAADTDVYFDLITKEIQTINAYVYNEDGSLAYTKTYDNMKKPYIVRIGNVTAGQSVQIQAGGEDSAKAVQAYIYGFNHANFINAYNLLNDEGLQVTKFEDNDVCGKVTAKQDGLLYTSISYDKGWSAYVDGKKVKTSALKEGMLTIPVSAGTHEIEFKYRPGGQTIGIVISVISLLIVIGLVVLSFRKKKAEKMARERIARIQAARERVRNEEKEEKESQNKTDGKKNGKEKSQGKDLD